MLQTIVEYHHPVTEDNHSVVQISTVADDHQDVFPLLKFKILQTLMEKPCYVVVATLGFISFVIV